MINRTSFQKEKKTDLHETASQHAQSTCCVSVKGKLIRAMRGSRLYTRKENLDKMVRGKTGNPDEDEDRILARYYIVDIPSSDRNGNDKSVNQYILVGCTAPKL